MNKMRPSSLCLVCHGRIPLTEHRQVDAGLDDPCQRLRRAAAVEYIAAADEVRLLQQLGAAVPGHRQPIWRGPLPRAIDRLKRADAECVRLKMWA